MRIQLDDYVTVPEAARIRGVSRQAVYKWCTKWGLRSKDVLGRLMVRKTDLEAFTPPQKSGRPPKLFGKIEKYGKK